LIVMALLMPRLAPVTQSVFAANLLQEDVDN
jgi:hypothetical protein